VGSAWRRVRGNGTAAAARAVRFCAKAVGQAAAPRGEIPCDPGPPTPGTPARPALSSVIPRPCSERGRGRTAWRAEGVPLMTVKKVLTGSGMAPGMARDGSASAAPLIKAKGDRSWVLAESCRQPGESAGSARGFRLALQPGESVLADPGAVC
jgi:hypothetical protein